MYHNRHDRDNRNRVTCLSSMVGAGARLGALRRTNVNLSPGTLTVRRLPRPPRVMDLLRVGVREVVWAACLSLLTFKG